MEMPKISPVKIETKGKGVFKRAWIWLRTTRKWKFEEDWILDLPDMDRVFIPKGFIFDGASIPKMLWPVISPTGTLFIPAIIHDFGYKYDAIWWLIGDSPHIARYQGRKYFDRLFLLIADEINGMAALNKTAYIALRMFGFIAWDKHRKNCRKNV